MFVDRQRELAYFDDLLTRQRPGPAQLILLYGRRRIGKTALLLEWAERNAVPHTYWAAEKEPADLQRRKLYARLLNLPIRQAPRLDSWAELWDAVAAIIADRRQILILDELPYAVESDPATLSALQHAWDAHFQHSSLVIVLCGSQVKVMESLQMHQSPLFGRLTGQWYLEPLPFSALRDFFPDWSAEERVAAYAVTGGVPAYLNWLDPALNLTANIRRIILSEGSMFLAEPAFLLYDEVREPQSYLATLKAIGLGSHTLGDISNDALIATSHLSVYLQRLQDLKLVERRLPAATPPAKRRTSRLGRYHLADPYFRFYFRFIAPFHEYLPFDTEQVLERIRHDLRGFVGGTAFEDLARQWVTQQGKAGTLPLRPGIVGAHWSRKVQIDVVAVDWEARQLLLGECKWGDGNVDRSVVRDLIEGKGELLRKELPDGEAWRFHYALFTRAGLTPAAAAELAKYDGLHVDLARLDGELV
ncbi:MAG TPA: ATP-binding protein [Promineifilum sp.]|nr:ATP-binding protein [Promineifilum sp.]HRO89853.1 ATP-binding protein [Promineifilum sp.]HRQ13137.1 ATP-binding protein [Promineifilum sp.]